MNEQLITDTSSNYEINNFTGSDGFGFGLDRGSKSKHRLTNSTWPKLSQDPSATYVHYNNIWDFGDNPDICYNPTNRSHFFIDPSGRFDTIDEFIYEVSNNPYDSAGNSSISISGDLENDLSYPIAMHKSDSQGDPLETNKAYIIYIRNLNLKRSSLEGRPLDNIINYWWEDLSGYFSSDVIGYHSFADVSLNIINWETLSHYFISNGIDTSGVTDMSEMFYNSSFNQNISDWNVAEVTDMNGMFYNSSFNQNIDGWNVAKVDNFLEMFRGNTDFDMLLESWDLSSATNIDGIFRTTSFNQDISGWNVSNVTEMGALFLNNNVFNQNISKWNVSKVRKMQYMFNVTNFNQNISDWNVSKLTDVRSMFKDNTKFNQDLSNWNLVEAANQGKIEDFSFNTPAWDPSYHPYFG